MAQLTFPTSPVLGTTYVAPNGVTYTFDTSVGTGVWRAVLSTSLSVTPGTISGTASVGSTLTYTTGVASSGSSPYTYAWEWKKASDNSVLQANGATYPIPVALAGDNVYVELTATDASLSTATASTATFPVPPAVILGSGITNAVAPITIPGTANFTWGDGAQNLSATGCIEFSLDGGATWLTASTPVTNGATITTQWKNVASSGLCGDAANGTVITGTLTDGIRTSNFSLTLDKVPNAFTLSPATETITPNSVTITTPSFTVAGINAPAKIWGAFTTTGSLPQYSVNGGTTWATIPTAPGTATVNNGQTVEIRFTTGAAAGTEVFTLDVGASTVAKQSGTFTVTVTNSGVTNAVAPTTIPGTANFTWADGAQNLSATGCIEFKVGAGSFTQASTPVVNGDTITTQWVNVASSGLCGDAANGTTITGTLTDGSRTTTFSLTLDRVPNAFTLSPATESIAPSSVTITNPSFVVSGINAPAKIWGTFATTGSSPQYTVDNGTTWSTLPTTPGTATVNNGDTVKIRFTTGPTAGATEVYNLNVGASATSKQSGTFTVTVLSTTVTNSVMPTTIPGTANFAWADGSSNLTATGCCEFSVNGGVSFGVGPTAVTNTTTVTTRWVNTSGSGLCGDAANGTTITGTLTNGSRTSSFSLTLDKVPSAFTLSPSAETIASSTVTISNPSFTVAGINAPAYIWGSFTTTGSNPQFTVNGGTTWTTLPTAPGTTTVTNGQTVAIRFTTGSAAPATEVYTLNVGASAASKQSGTFTATVSASAITNAVMPTTTPGTANFTWANGADTLSATGCCEFSVDGGSIWGVGPTAVTNTTTVTTRWVSVSGSGLCGDAAHGTTITGSLVTPSRTSSFSLAIDRLPAAFTLSPSTQTTTPNTVTTANPTFTLSGTNAPSYFWGTFGANPGTLPEFTTDGGTTWSSIPSAFGTGTTINPASTVKIRFKTGSTVGSSPYTIDVGNSATSKQSGTFTVTVATAPFPLTVLVAPTTIPGIGGPVTWADGATSITGTGCIEFSKNGGTYTQASTAVVNGDLIRTQWVTSPACNGAANGTTITGTVTNGVYTNSFSLVIDRAPSAFTFTDLTVQPISSQKTSNVVTLAGTNATAYVTRTTGTLTTVQASVNGGAWTTIPASGTTMPIDPGQTIQIRGTTGATLSTAYTATIDIGGVTDVWSVTTASVAPSVSTPSIVTPASNATGIVTSPTLTGSTYTANGGAGVQKCASWQLVPGDTTTRTGTSSDAWGVVGSPWTFPTVDVSTARSFYGAGKLYLQSFSPMDGSIITFVSSDSGVSWTKNAPATPTSAGNGNLSCINSNGVICRALRSNSTAYYSADDGGSWTAITGPTGNVDQTICQIAGTTTMIWNTISGGNQFIYRSTNNGSTWTLVYTGSLTDTGGAFASTFVQTLGSVVTCIANSAASGGAYTAVSTDAGLTWSGYSRTAGGIYTAGSDAWWAISGTGIRRSLDGGLTFVQVATTAAANPTFYQGSGSGTNAAIISSAGAVTPFNTTTYALGTTTAAVDFGVYAMGDYNFATTSTKIVGLAFNSQDGTNYFPYAYDTSVATKAMKTTGVNLSTKYAQNAPVLANNAATGTVDFVSYRSGPDSHMILNAPAAAGWATATSYALDAVAITPKTVDVTCDLVNLSSYPVTGLTAATSYSARVQYESIDPYTSSWSAWSVFTTA